MEVRPTYSAMATRQADNDQSKKTQDLSKTSQLRNNVKDMNKMIVMRATATRKPLEKLEKIATRDTTLTLNQSSNFRQDISKLRTPFYKQRLKQVQTEEKFMSKSCEILFECIKPYKDIVKNTKIQVMESSQTVRRPIQSSIMYERKATRKVEFLRFSEENSAPSFFNMNEPLLDTFDTLKSEGGIQFFSSEKSEGENEKMDPEENRKIISSEDFIKNAFFPSESAFL